MGLETFPSLSNHTCLISHGDKIFKLKLEYEEMAAEQTAAFRTTVSESAAHCEIEDVFRAVLYNTERGINPFPIQTDSFRIVPKYKTWPLSKKVTFQSYGKPLHCHPHMIIFEIQCKNLKLGPEAAPDERSQSAVKKQNTERLLAPKKSPTAIVTTHSLKLAKLNQTESNKNIVEENEDTRTRKRKKLNFSNVCATDNSKILPQATPRNCAPCVSGNPKKPAVANLSTMLKRHDDALEVVKLSTSPVKKVKSEPVSPQLASCMTRSGRKRKILMVSEEGLSNGPSIEEKTASNKHRTGNVSEVHKLNSEKAGSSKGNGNYMSPDTERSHSKPCGLQLRPRSVRTMSVNTDVGRADPNTGTPRANRGSLTAAVGFTKKGEKKQINNNRNNNSTAQKIFPGNSSKDGLNTGNRTSLTITQSGQELRQEKKLLLEEGLKEMCMERPEVYSSSMRIGKNKDVNETSEKSYVSDSVSESSSDEYHMQEKTMTTVANKGVINPMAPGLLMHRDSQSNQKLSVKERQSVKSMFLHLQPQRKRPNLSNDIAQRAHLSASKTLHDLPDEKLVKKNSAYDLNGSQRSLRKRIDTNKCTLCPAGKILHRALSSSKRKQDSSFDDLSSLSLSPIQSYHSSRSAPLSRRRQAVSPVTTKKARKTKSIVAKQAAGRHKSRCHHKTKAKSGSSSAVSLMNRLPYLKEFRSRSTSLPRLRSRSQTSHSQSPVAQLPKAKATLSAARKRMVSCRDGVWLFP